MLNSHWFQPICMMQRLVSRFSKSHTYALLVGTKSAYWVFYINEVSIQINIEEQRADYSQPGSRTVSESELS